jgi:hypothetical protein
MWKSGVPGYPPDLTLGNLSGLSADVRFTPGQTGDQPYYMLVFTDPTERLGQASAADQILMLEFQTSTLSGNSLAFDPNTTRLNLFDNTTGTYLNDLLGGQQYTKTLAGWIAADPFLAGESLQQVRVAIGLSGGGTHAESLTVNSLDITHSTPEPTTFFLLGAGLGVLGLVRRRRG